MTTRWIKTFVTLALVLGSLGFAGRAGAQVPSAVEGAPEHHIVVTLAGTELEQRQVREALLLTIPWEDLSEEIFPGEAVPVAVVFRRWNTLESIEEDARDYPYSPRRARVLLLSRKLRGFAPRIIVRLDPTGRASSGEELSERERQIGDAVIEWLAEAGMVYWGEWREEDEELLARPSFFDKEPLMLIEGKVGSAGEPR